MSDMLETLALRGAGLVPADGRTLLVPRLRSRFEPASGAPAAGDIAIASEEVRGADIPRAPAPDGRVAVSSGIDEPPAPTRSTTPAPAPAPDTVPEASVARREPTVPPRVGDGSRRSSPTEDRTPTIGEAVAEPSRAEPPGAGSETVVVRQAAAEARPAATIEVSLGPTAPLAELRADVEQVKRALKAPMQPVPDRPSSAPSEIEAPSPARAIASAKQRHDPAFQRIERPEPASPIMVSIGRIEVELARPEPARPAPRPQVERTRGFEAYARARRGHLR